MKIEALSKCDLMQGEEGQDLIEYALVVALIAHAGGRGKSDQGNHERISDEIPDPLPPASGSAFG